MLTSHIDLGQLIIASLIAIVGWFTKRTIESIEKRITRHETMFFQINTHIQRIIGHLGVDGGNNPFRHQDLKDD